MGTLYEILDQHCRNKKSGKPMPHKNWPKPNTKIVRSVNHDPDETSPEIMQVTYNGTVLLNAYDDGRIQIVKVTGNKVVKSRVNMFLSIAATEWSIEGWHNMWLCFQHDKITKYEPGITIKPVPAFDMSTVKEGTIATCFYCECEVFATHSLGTDRWYWMATHEADYQEGDRSYCQNGWKKDYGRWHSPVKEVNDGLSSKAQEFDWTETEGDYSIGDVSTCRRCKSEISLQIHGRAWVMWVDPAVGLMCTSAPVEHHPIGEGRYHVPDGTVKNHIDVSLPEEFPTPKPKLKSKPKSKPVQHYLPPDIGVGFKSASCEHCGLNIEDQIPSHESNVWKLQPDGSWHHEGIGTVWKTIPDLSSAAMMAWTGETVCKEAPTVDVLYDNGTVLAKAVKLHSPIPDTIIYRDPWNRLSEAMRRSLVFLGDHLSIEEKALFNTIAEKTAEGNKTWVKSMAWHWVERWMELGCAKTYFDGVGKTPTSQTVVEEVDPELEELVATIDSSVAEDDKLITDARVEFAALLSKAIALHQANGDQIHVSNMKQHQRQLLKGKKPLVYPSWETWYQTECKQHIPAHVVELAMSSKSNEKG